MHVLLVNMPWAPVDLPSLGLGIMRRVVETKVPEGRVTTIDANLDYVDWITERTSFSADDYEYYSFESYFHGVGDWVFSSALYGDPGWRVREFREYFGNELGEALTEKTVALHTSAPEFVRGLAERIVEFHPDVLGLTAVFQQTTAALAVARYVKEISPAVVTVLGGSSFDAEQGAAVHRNFPFVDYVVRGEGEVAFPQLLASLADTAVDRTDIPALCWRKEGGSVANPIPMSPTPPSALVPPDFSGYFDRLAASTAGLWTSPTLPVEGSRGCWWGEKHQCTFCGLNGSHMEFRSKRPEVFRQEILAQVREHKVLDVCIVDNILDMSYLTSLLPALIEDNYDLRFHVEVKSNLRAPHLRLLAAAGMTFVQPGIESLSTHVLRLMDKGVTGCQNVRILRDGQSAGLAIAWNYLHGFPGELDRDYDDVVEQFPVLSHLEPPAGLSGRITIERFSPYFTRPELGFSPLKSAGYYSLIYDLSEEELFDLAYVFDAQQHGVGPETILRLNEGLAVWRKSYPGSRLSHLDLGDRIVLVNRRPDYVWRTLELRDALELAVFRLLEDPRTLTGLARRLADAGHQVQEAKLQGILGRWQELGIIFTDAGQFIHVAPVAVNQHLSRLNCLRRFPDDVLRATGDAP
ncbi:RiPP maturation radical SAM C-methyltransferase [Streptomyces sp. NPDC086023]|uniref:RiPP maturation radical SAM C-methyltransferase n=1 Tax=Streptomyces sp. NPDC086023 TaxID=3365746 RepID=UPI0037CCF35E